VHARRRGVAHTCAGVRKRERRRFLGAFASIRLCNKKSKCYISVLEIPLAWIMTRAASGSGGIGGTRSPFILIREPARFIAFLSSSGVTSKRIIGIPTSSNYRYLARAAYLLKIYSDSGMSAVYMLLPCLSAWLHATISCTLLCHRFALRKSDLEGATSVFRVERPCALRSARRDNRVIWFISPRTR